MLESGHNVASENVQSRLRGLIVMAHATQGRMAIATGNKSELAKDTALCMEIWLEVILHSVIGTRCKFMQLLKNQLKSKD